MAHEYCKSGKKPTDIFCTTKPRTAWPSRFPYCRVVQVSRLRVAGVFAKACANPSSGPAILPSRFDSTTTKRAWRRTGAAVKRKRKLKPLFGVVGNFERVPPRPNDGRPIQHTRWVELVPVLHSTRTVVSASRLEPTDDRGTRCSGQKRDLGDPSLALSDGCNGLRARSLKPPTWSSGRSGRRGPT
jgi:hypothetical protein